MQLFCLLLGEYENSCFYLAVWGCSIYIFHYLFNMSFDLVCVIKLFIRRNWKYCSVIILFLLLEVMFILVLIRMIVVIAVVEN